MNDTRPTLDELRVDLQAASGNFLTLACGDTIYAPHRIPDQDACAEASRRLRWLESHLASLLEDAERLDAISAVGAKTRVYMMATENVPNPPRTRRASVSIPHGQNADYVSDRSSLREAIDAARFGRGDAAKSSSAARGET